MATKKPKPAEGSAPYTVQRNLDHDQLRYAPGETVHLEPHESEPLLAAGVVVVPRPAAAAGAK